MLEIDIFFINFLLCIIIILYKYDNKISNLYIEEKTPHIKTDHNFIKTRTKVVHKNESQDCVRVTFLDKTT